MIYRGARKGKVGYAHAGKAGQISFARARGAPALTGPSWPTPNSPGRWPCGSGSKRRAPTTSTCSPAWRNGGDAPTSPSKAPTASAATGFGRDRITTGWLKTSLRTLDEQNSRPFDPVPAFSHPQPLAPGQVVPVDIALGPSATFFKAGEMLRLIVAGRWLWPRNPLTGQFPAAYQRGPKDTPALGTTTPGPPPRPRHFLTGIPNGPNPNWPPVETLIEAALPGQAC